MTNWITVKDALKGRALAVERAVQNERERIIKLLEDSEVCMCEAIALIKGEKK